jgi:hypothetical protein
MEVAFAPFGVPRGGVGFEADRHDPRLLSVNVRDVEHRPTGRAKCRTSGYYLDPFILRNTIS